MSSNDKKLTALRQKITESLRIQRDSSEAVPYIDAANILADVCARQNHAIFARRGCDKTLLLHHSGRLLDKSIRTVYLNCEDFKRHSFPNVLIEILDALFRELERHLTGWFGKKKRSRELIKQIRAELLKLKSSADSLEESVRNITSAEQSTSAEAALGVTINDVSAKIGDSIGAKSKTETERSFKVRSDKLRELDMWLPRLKEQVREFFEVSNSVKAVFLQIDDFYHLKKTDQPFVIDYIHRLCKDVPLYFKIATLRHASSLYIDRDGQPFGAQERHDYQPINIDYTFADFVRTRDQNRRIFHEFGKLVGLRSDDIDGLFKGEGFDRLVMAGGGVPRDTLSLFLEVLSSVQSNGGDKIGKDDVRVMSRSNFERRIEELKHDSEGGEQDVLMRGIHVFRTFCLSKKSNAFVIAEQALQQRDEFRDLVNRLLDYRIIHNAGAAITHKSKTGTYQAFSIDIGCYANFRKLDGRFVEIDLSEKDAKERLRSAPVFDSSDFETLFGSTPKDIELALMNEVVT
ncbi:hypothetical protein BIU88_00770 [Chlorobaculum limnaeum]|uniref:Uncharacterized protein n=1 Tax=Chlorobaculum limnaeum TaxID=274537 RepID=A0A1D8CVE3_CHLLM|nr:hypothetical protein [Chlorobaculum limnaeum]AOS82810.1 hypothetical protein BIU88_00770 [Chlorobaculum limnaeum]